MQDNHLRIQSFEKKLILVVDDEIINREMLGATLSEDYSVIFASDGKEALDQIQRHAEDLSLILLDLLMPVVSGMVVLRKIRETAEWSEIPVIVMTSDHESEVASLELGAADFISKPYPQSSIMLARIRRVIELSEDRQIIHSTERDSLTGLYNKDFFYSYASAFDQHHKKESMDAIVVDINHFHMVNERYGRQHADQILQRIGSNLRNMVQNTGGIVCRREADTFLIYCPHRSDYSNVLEIASRGLSDDESPISKVYLRLGVYPDVEKTMTIEQRFDRAKAAADKVRGDYTRNIGVYDVMLHEAELFAEQLDAGFDEAIDQKQFKVFYQPKYDVRSDRPILTSAEALIRWQHPQLGLLSPGVFIPLFEKNGMISRLDHYVWEEAAAQIKEWKDTYGLTIPVSVNVSRVDMSDSGIVDCFETLLKKYDLNPESLILEITESAYSEEEAFIISIVDSLRNLGMRVEMDDFGTGYSSLSMISKLPIDALKMDMTFVRNAFSANGDMRMIELIIDIAKYLDVPVIAEGVETEEQMSVLKAMGCEIIQGYYFSKPVAPPEFNKFIEEKQAMLEEMEGTPEHAPEKLQIHANAVDIKELDFAQIAQALFQNYFAAYYINIKTGAYIEYSLRGDEYELFPVFRGRDFFEDCTRLIPERVLPSDRNRVLEAFEKRNLLRVLRSNQKSSINYQVLVGNRPANVNAKATRLKDDEDHILLGLSNIDEKIKQEKAYQEVLEQNVTYASLALALAADYFSIYYVDTETDRFFEFTAHDAFEDLGIEKEGEDFFNLSRKNIQQVMYPEDQKNFLEVFTKENILEQIRERGAFTVTYRLMIQGVPTYVNLKATAMSESDTGHIVIGVNNIHSQIKRQEDYEEAQRQSVTFSRIAEALSKDYYSIYMVNMQTEEYVEYSSNAEYKELQIEQSGTNFFAECRRNVIRLVHPDDLKKALPVWEKERLIQELKGGASFSVTYRLMFDNVGVYINSKVIRMTGDQEGYILIGISNVDAQIKREQEYEKNLKNARTAAMRDGLTGVKSKHAFTEAEQKINEAIAADQQQPFAIAICDVNGLKQINDTLGHKAGDQHIKKACSIICTQFKHSPVFRIGGDEFVAILQGSDYEKRETLVDQFVQQNKGQSGQDSVVIACGMANWRKETGETIESVFQRADERMYANKTALKTI